MKKTIFVYLSLLLFISLATISLAQTKVISIPAASFHPAQEEVGAYYTADGDDVHVSGPFGSGVSYGNLVAPLILPNGASIKKIIVYAAQSHQFGSTLYLIKSSVVDGESVRATLSTINLDGIVEDEGIRKFLKLFLLWKPQINNVNSTYFLKFRARSQEAGDVSYIHHVEVYYSEPVAIKK